MARITGKPSARVEKRILTEQKGCCAKCQEPLYGNVNDTDDKINYRGMTAHIRAASSNGPRYDEDYVDVHGYENLLILCSDCHKTIDDDDNADSYTVEKLEKMKYLSIR